ncbi:MAG: ATP-binding protein, partial [Planctomycetaceae bacterium]|nr:ATP-binding protein [Planctomycetaceae bacterium]
MNRKFTTNSRLIPDLFARYISTFAAFCELINNSLQARAKNIWVDIDYRTDELFSTPIKKIVIKDDGEGVHVNELNSKILDIGTPIKDGGKGVGRFAAFQIGKSIEIETVGYSQTEQTFSKTTIPLQVESFGKAIDITSVDVETKEEILSGHHDTYYQVSINKLYSPEDIIKEPKRKIIEKFSQDKIQDAIFERYPLKIFNKEIKIYINGFQINPNHFVIGNPIIKTIPYTDKKEKDHEVKFDFFQIKNLPDTRKVFLTAGNAGIPTIAAEFEYEAEWLSPKIGSWFIYISCDTLYSDMYRNIYIDGLDENVKHYQTFIKDTLNEFFKEKNQEFDNFIDKLKKDDYYPYKDKASSSQSKIFVFDKLAFLVEHEYKLLKENNKLREVVYPLIDRTISNGELDAILRNVLKLNNKAVAQFSNLLEKTELENIIEFSDKVASKVEDLEFIEKLVYSEIAKNIKERKHLHKILEKMLWIFGEEYATATKLFSDKNLENNLMRLREDLMTYKPSQKDDNIVKVEKSIKSITDLFMFNERIIDEKHREVLIVELKAPKVKISPKELGQVMKYATEIRKSPITPIAVKFKILLVSSEINSDAAFQIKGKEDNPFFYFEHTNVEICVMKWADLLENLKRKLKYMSAILKIKDVDVQEKVSRDFADIDIHKIKSNLKKV